jgi:hypothetical protein
MSMILLIKFLLNFFFIQVPKANVTKDGVRHVSTKLNGDAKLFADVQRVSTTQVKERASHFKNDSLEEIPFSGPLIVSSSSGFAWAKKRDGCSFTRSRTRSSSRDDFAAEVGQDNKLQLVLKKKKKDNKLQLKENVGLKEQHNRDVQVARVNPRVQEPHEVANRAVLKKWSQLERPDSFDSRDTYHSQKFSNAIYLGDALSSKNSMKVRHWFI